MSRVQLPAAVLAHLDQITAQANTGLDAFVADTRQQIAEQGRDVALVELVHTMTRDAGRACIAAAVAIVRLAEQPVGGDR